MSDEMKINDIYKEIEIIDDNHNGMGIAKINNIPIFVDKVLKGDIVNIKVTRITKKYLQGDIINFITKTKREPINCPYYDICGGCSLLHIPFEKENELKKQYIKKLFKDYNPKITYFERFNYRNKVTLHVKNNKLGFYEDKSHKLITINKCLLLKNDINELIIKMNDFNLKDITEIIIKQGINGLLLSIKGKLTKKDLEKLINNKKVISIYQNDKHIFGEKSIIEQIGNLKYVCNHNSFFQINNDCTKALYDKIKENVDEGCNLLDLYCGSGTIGIYCSDICKKITGVEINKDSVKCFQENIKLNNIKNYQITLGDASIIKDKFDIIVVDPPRSGLSKKVINNIKSINPNKIIYVSCNPSTLKRDINMLNNYNLKEISIFNMFPSTKHIETITVLEIK